MKDVRASHRGGTDPRRALSLTEVVASVLALGFLACALLPSLGAARRRSQQSTCVDRLHALGEATSLFSADDATENAIPVHPLFSKQDPQNPAYIGAYEWGGKSGIGRTGWYHGVGSPEMNSRYGTQAGFGPATRPLNKYLYPHGFRNNNEPTISRTGWILDTKLDLPAFRCPADDGPPSGGQCPDWLHHKDRSAYDQFGTSYSANIFWVVSSEGTLQSNSPYLRPQSQVPNPSRTTLYEEAIGSWVWSVRRYPEVCLWSGQGLDPGPTWSVRSWHDKAWTYNMAFVDGHAGPRAIYIEGSEDNHGYALHRRIERVFDDDDMQTRYQCIIVRGDGWQKDTLPAPFIETGLHGFASLSYENCLDGAN